MKPSQKNHSLKNLRQMIDRTQNDFATMIGASKDTVISWENGRNPLSDEFAARIFQATGADPHVLKEGKGLVLNDRGEPYKREDFDRWRNDPERNSVEAFERYCTDTLALLLRAASIPGRGKLKDRLPGVFTSFAQWAEQTRKNFNLTAEIDQLLAQRKCKAYLTQTYGEWRRLRSFFETVTKECQFEYSFQFPDDPEKPETEELRLCIEQTPEWEPGGDMKTPSPYNSFADWKKE